MTVLVVWLRIDLRRRWRSLVVLALLIAVTRDTVIAARLPVRRSLRAE